MRKHFITIAAICGTCLAVAVQAQTSTGQSSPGSSNSDPGAGQNYDNARRFGSMGRMGHQEVRASKIMSAEVKDSQKQTLGTINDVIFNPNSGRIDFAVVSLSANSGTTDTTSSPPSTGSSLATAAKLVPIPWMLLRSSSSAPGGSTSSSSSTVSATGQPEFTFSGDRSKLESAPSFDQSNWPDITQAAWRQSVYAHFGMTAGSSTGGATSPGGSESSSGTSSSSPPSPSPDSSSSSKPQQQ